MVAQVSFLLSYSWVSARCLLLTLLLPELDNLLEAATETAL